MMDAVLMVHAGATLFMTGVIWFVQTVHYPLLGAVGEERFAAYEAKHTVLATRVVAPPMLAELATAIWIAWHPPLGVPAAAAYAGLALVGTIWMSTWAAQVPQHRILERGFSPRAHRRLVRTNWIRTLAWTARTVLALFWLACAMS